MDYELDGESQIFKIDISEVMDYCWCPMYYHLKKTYPNKKIITNVYDERLHQCFYGYITQIKNSNFVDLKYLKKIWGKIWIKEGKNSELIVSPSPNPDDSYNNKRKDGIQAIITFHDMMKEDKQYPILINKEYNIPIAKNIILTGKWEYIRELQKEDKKTFQILRFYTLNNRFSTIMQMRHDLELTAASYAFKQLFKNVDPELVYINIYKKRAIETYRNEKDYKLLKQTVTNVVRCIKNNVFYLCPDTKCYHCEYRKECENKIKF